MATQFVFPRTQFSDAENYILSSTHCVDRDGIQIDLRCLDSDWLSDDIINYYLAIVADRTVGAASTFLLAKLRQCKQPDGTYAFTPAEPYAKNILDKRAVLVPLHIKNSHWALACVDLVANKMYVFDSMSPSAGVLEAAAIVEQFMRHLTGNSYDIIDLGSRVAQQSNGSDCGVFCCYFAMQCVRAFQFMALEEYFYTELSFADAHYLRRYIKLKIISST